jgi:short-subunit dehydrogenase
MKPPIDDAVALVTGASSGIGVEIARLLAPRVRVLVLVARRRERLETLAAELAEEGCEAVVEPCDLVDREAVASLVERVTEAHGPVDLLVNNAGLGDMGMFDLVDWEKTEKMIELNVRALTFLTHRVVGPMVERGRGGILNISSGFGLAFAPGFAAYIGTKHYVTGFSEALRLELRPCGVTVTQVCPGPVATEFEQNLGNFTEQDVPGLVEITARRCARDALRGFEKGRALVIPGRLMKLVMGLNRWTPRFLNRWVVGAGAKWMRSRQRRALGA